MDGLTAVPRVQIFATDIDERALAVARAGALSGSRCWTASRPSGAERFFIADGGSYVVAKDVRDLCIFSPHSVIRDPPFSRIDLVSCRNLLIYFGRGRPEPGDPDLPLRAAARTATCSSARPRTSASTATCSRRSTRSTASSAAATDVDAPRCACRLCHARAAAGAAGRAPDAGARRWPASRCGRRSRSRCWSASRRRTWWSTATATWSIIPARTGKYLEAAAGAPTRQLLAHGAQGAAPGPADALREAVETRPRGHARRHRGRERRWPRAARRR